MLSEASRRRLKRLRSIAPRWTLRLAGQLEDGGTRMPPRPPRCPPGWSIGPPDFVGVGAQRAGTTRWFELMAAHPEVARPTSKKELHFFDRFYGGGCGAEELARYREFFPREGDSKAGEWTPVYMSAPWIPPLLAAAAPDTRVLVLLRDPLERFLSGIEHTPAEITAMNPAQVLAYRVSEANMVKTPYLVITAVFLFVALLIFLTKLPEIRETNQEGLDASNPKFSGTFSFPFRPANRRVLVGLTIGLAALGLCIRLMLPFAPS